jgi:hypothetical protein
MDLIFTNITFYTDDESHALSIDENALAKMTEDDFI